LSEVLKVVEKEWFRSVSRGYVVCRHDDATPNREVGARPSKAEWASRNVHSADTQISRHPQALGIISGITSVVLEQITNGFTKTESGSCFDKLSTNGGILGVALKTVHPEPVEGW